MPDIHALMQKDSKKKFKKSTYRPWNYLEELDKELQDKKEIVKSIIEPPEQIPVVDHTNATSEIKYSPQIDEIADNQINRKDIKDSKDDSPLYCILRLSGHQKVIFGFVLDRCLARGQCSSGYVTSDVLVNLTKTSISMVNTSVQRLVDKKLIFRENGKRGRGGFYCFGISEAVRDAAVEYKRLSTYDVPHTDETKSIDNQQEHFDLSKPEDNFINKNNFPKELDMVEIDPLADIGFTKGHLQQLFKKGVKDTELIQDSINHYAFDLKYNKKESDIKKTTPIGYFMGIMLKIGIYTRPDNYESSEDRALRILLESKKTAKEKRDAMMKELSDIAFDEWLTKLSEEEKNNFLPEDIKKSKYKGAKLITLKAYFIKNIWPQLALTELNQNSMIEVQSNSK